MRFPPSRRREEEIKKLLRRICGLADHQNLHPPKAEKQLTPAGQDHPPPCISFFQRQADAVAYREEIINDGSYSAHHVGVFAQEIGDGGVRRFLVDTFPGFAHDHAPYYAEDVQPGRGPKVTTPLSHNELNSFLRESRCSADAARLMREQPETVQRRVMDLGSLRHTANPSAKLISRIKTQYPTPAGTRHMYEVILENRPCWLYFDLEYQKEYNTGIDPGEVMAAFLSVLDAFCLDVLGAPLDHGGVLVLDSTTPTKFSKHIVVKWLPSMESCDAHTHDTTRTPVAFANNAQVGLFVQQLVSYASHRKDNVGSPAKFLFFRGKPIARGSGLDVETRECSQSNVGEPNDVCLIDQAVYTRNRCFRSLFHSKFGKNAVLMVERVGEMFTSFPASRALLDSMVSWVPDGTRMFRHSIIPRDYEHKAAVGIRVHGVHASSQDALGNVDEKTRVEVSLHDGLIKFLIEEWDRIRQANEADASHNSRPTSVASIMQTSEDFLTVTLRHNRFCFCKGASHVSNSIYLVIDKMNRSFRQKCFDIDCKYFWSPPFQIPEDLVGVPTIARASPAPSCQRERSRSPTRAPMHSRMDQRTDAGPEDDESEEFCDSELLGACKAMESHLGCAE